MPGRLIVSTHTKILRRLPDRLSRNASALSMQRIQRRDRKMFGVDFEKSAQSLAGIAAAEPIGAQGEQAAPERDEVSA